MENRAMKIEGTSFITSEKIAAINEIKDMCFLPTVKEHKNFLILVAASAGCDRIQDIQEKDFGTAYLTAKQILHRIGAAVFTKQSHGGDYEQ